jgi:CBS domain-containing protein
MLLTVRDVALRAPVAIAATTSIREGEQRLISGLASELYVIDEDERLLGVVPDYEILKYRLLGGAGDDPISELATPVRVWLAPTASLQSGSLLLREHVHTSIPIVEQGRLIGQLCRINLLRILAEQPQAAGESSPAAAVIPPPRFLNTSHLPLAAFVAAE